MTGRRWLVCYAIDWQTLTGMSLACRPSLACHAWANLGWHTSFPADLCCWHAIVLACHLLSIYAAKLCLISSLPTICTISNYLHYFQLFTTTLPNYSQLFALFPTIHKYFQQANLSWHAIHGQTLVGIPVSSRPVLLACHCTCLPFVVNLCC